VAMVVELFSVLIHLAVCKHLIFPHDSPLGRGSLHLPHLYKENSRLSCGWQS
jgi:hypothetical protein